jgi:hypothetical protein
LAYSCLFLVFMQYILRSAYLSKPYCEMYKALRIALSITRMLRENDIASLAQRSTRNAR